MPNPRSYCSVKELYIYIHIALTTKFYHNLKWNSRPLQACRKKSFGLWARVGQFRAFREETNSNTDMAISSVPYSSPCSPCVNTQTTQESKCLCSGRLEKSRIAISISFKQWRWIFYKKNEIYNSVTDYLSGTWTVWRFFKYTFFKISWGWKILLLHTNFGKPKLYN